jgi:mannose-6-phosphate isomerase-like protein (cupin superfamily)
MSAYDVIRVEELDRIPVEEGLEWRTIRRRLGIQAFGTNAYTSAHVGAIVVEEHDERSGHEELYVVLSGRATFTLDGDEIDAPAGTIVFIREPTVRRKAVSEEEGTTVLAVGGWPDKPFQPSAWEWYFEAYAQEPERGIAILEQGLGELGDNPALFYHLACLEARAARLEDARGHLARAIELAPEMREWAEKDDDLVEVRR